MMPSERCEIKIVHQAAQETRRIEDELTVPVGKFAAPPHPGTLTPNQARDLAQQLNEKADEAEKEFNLLKVGGTPYVDQHGNHYIVAKDLKGLYKLIGRSAVYASFEAWTKQRGAVLQRISNVVGKKKLTFDGKMIDGA